MQAEEAPTKSVWGYIGIATLIVWLLVGAWEACNRTQPLSAPSPVAGNSFRIVAESQIKALQDAGILDAFSRETGIPLAIVYRGPVDIRNAVSKLSAKNPTPVDAYWPGSRLWLPGSYTVEPQTVMKTYVILAVDPDAARDLGWNTAEGITSLDVVNAIQAGKIHLAMTNATQSTPGAVFSLAMYTALTGKPVLTSEDLQNAELTDHMQTLLGGVKLTAADLDHLAQLFIDDQVSGAHETNAIVTYEGLAIPLNQKLIANGLKPMMVFYVDGATAMADAPVRYVDNGDAKKLEQYQKFVEFLNRPDIQERIRDLGWRTNPIGMKCDECDPAVFNPAWGIDTKTERHEMNFPKLPIADAALAWIQSRLRRPSFTVYCLDYSGSMDTGGRTQMVDAMDLLLNQDRASKVLLQATAGDVVRVYGFSDDVHQVGSTVRGNDQTELKNLSSAISSYQRSQGTAMFDCVETALQFIGTTPDPRYSYSVIALTDGMSNQGAGAGDFAAFYRNGHYIIPVYGIALGSADFSQLDQFKGTGGDVYDGRGDVAQAFRVARGNN